MFLFLLSSFLIIVSSNAAGITNGPGPGPLTRLQMRHFTDKPERGKPNRVFNRIVNRKVAYYLADQAFFYQLRFGANPNPVNSKEEYFLRRQADPLFKDLPMHPEKTYGKITKDHIESFSPEAGFWEWIFMDKEKIYPPRSPDNLDYIRETFPFYIHSESGNPDNSPQNNFNWNHYLGLEVIHDTLGFISVTKHFPLKIFNQGLTHLGMYSLESFSQFPDLFPKSNKDYFEVFLIIFNVGLAQYESRLKYYITSPEMLSTYTEGQFSKVPEVSTWLKGFPDGFFSSVFTTLFFPKDFTKIRNIDDVFSIVKKNNDFFKNHKKERIFLSVKDTKAAPASTGETMDGSTANPKQQSNKSCPRQFI